MRRGLVARLQDQVTVHDVGVAVDVGIFLAFDALTVACGIIGVAQCAVDEKQDVLSGVTERSLALFRMQMKAESDGF